MCKFIIKNDANLSPQDSHGSTPLHLAAEAGQLEIFKMIFEDVDEKSPLNSSHYTPFHDAAESGHLDICKFIIENKIDPNIRGSDGETPLHLAARSGHLTTFKFLFHVVLDKSPLTDYKDTPLHYAAASGHVEVCKFIVENMKDSLKRKNDGGKTPLDEALEEGQEKVCNVLKFQYEQADSIQLDQMCQYCGIMKETIEEIETHVKLEHEIKLYEDLHKHPAKCPRFSIL